MVDSLEMLPYIICIFLRDDRNDSERQSGTHSHSTCPFYNALKMVRSPLHPYEDFRKTPDLS